MSAGAGQVGRCSVPMWRDGLPDGFCERPASGAQYKGRHTPPRFCDRDANTRRPYAPRLCCEVHGGPGENDIRFMRDGNMWCAFMPGFENLQESDAGFGKTQDAAEDDLRSRNASVDRSGEAGETAQHGSTEGESAVGESRDAQRPTS